MVALLGDQHLVEPGPALGPDFVGEFLAQFDLGLRAEFERHQFLRTMADAVGDIVTGDVEDAPVIEHAPHDDMGMGMAGVVMIDGDPIQVRPEVGFHLPHQVAGEAAQVAHICGVLRCHDEPELMAVVASALDERLAVGFVLDGRIAAAFLAVARHAIAFEITQMGIDRLGAGPAAHLRPACARPLSLSGQLHHPRLHHDAARAEAADGISLPTATVARDRRHYLRVATTRVEPSAASVPGASRSRAEIGPVGIAARLAHGDFHLRNERQVARGDTRSLRSRTSRLDAEIAVVTICHNDRIGIGFGLRKT